MKVVDNGNGQKIFTNVKNDDIYKEIIEMRQKLELLTSPEWREGSCPYKSTIQGLWQKVGFIAGIFAVVGSIITAVIIHFI